MTDLYDMTRPALLSVVVPVGEMQGRLKNLRGWLHQIGSHPIQVILVCDLVGDDCLEELHYLINILQNDNIILAQGRFGSPGEARNAGVGLSTAEWIAFWDSDDIPNWKIVIKSIQHVASEVEVVVGGFETRQDSDSHLIRRELPVPGNTAENLNSLAFNPGLWRMVFRRQLINTVSFSKFRMGEDHLYVLQLSLPNRNIHFSSDVFYQYFLGDPGHLTRSQDAIQDLAGVILSNILELKKVELSQSRYVANFLAREFLTLVKRGSWRSRWISLKLVTKLPREVGIRKTLQVFSIILNLLVSH